MNSHHRTRGKKKENIRCRYRRRREREREKQTREQKEQISVDFGAKKDIATIKRSENEIYKNMDDIKVIIPEELEVMNTTRSGAQRQQRQRKMSDCHSTSSTKNSTSSVNENNNDNESTISHPDIQIQEREEGGEKEEEKQEKEGKEEEEEKEGGKLSDSNSRSSLDQLPKECNPLLVDITEEACWKQNTHRDKDSQNVNKITRYGVGYKKCTSHSHASKYDHNFKSSTNVQQHFGNHPNALQHNPTANANFNNSKGRFSNYGRNAGYHNHNCYKYSNKSFSRPNVFCSNCGAYGHLYRNCNYAITSYGIICFRFKTDKDTITPEYLMVQRHKSLNYVEFVRGKWSKNNRKYLIQMFNNMTEEERMDIGNLSFAQIWKGLWKKKEFNSSDREYRESKAKFEELKNGYLIENKDGSRIKLSIDYLLKNSKSTISESEWGFPKGKRLNEKESDFNCAMREFIEETSIKQSYVDVKTYKPYEEEFSGSNNIRYKHVYYLAQCSTNNDKLAFSKDIHDVVDIDEIRNVKWFKHTDGLEIIRSSNPQRKDLFTRVNNCVMKNLEVRIKR